MAKQIQWETSLTTAKAKAKKEKKLILMDFLTISELGANSWQLLLTPISMSVFLLRIASFPSRLISTRTRLW